MVIEQTCSRRTLLVRCQIAICKLALRESATYVEPGTSGGALDRYQLSTIRVIRPRTLLMVDIEAHHRTPN
jgi:hypothetical protein